MSDQAVDTALGQLPRHLWTVVRHPQASPDAAVEHIVVGSRGVFLIGTLPDSLSRLVEARDTVASRVSGAVGAERVYAVHCVPGQAASGSIDGVLLCSPGTLVDTLVRRRGVISPQQVIQALLEVDAELVAEVGGGSAAYAAASGSIGGTATLVAPTKAPARAPHHRVRELLGLFALSAVVVILTVFALLSR